MVNDAHVPGGYAPSRHTLENLHTEKRIFPPLTPTRPATSTRKPRSTRSSTGARRPRASTRACRPWLSCTRSRSRWRERRKDPLLRVQVLECVAGRGVAAGDVGVVDHGASL